MKKKEMIPLTNEEKNIYQKQKVCYICKKRFSIDDKKYQKVRDHCNYIGKHRAAAHNICSLRYKTSREIPPAVFHNGATYDHKFTIKELAKEFDGQFECLGQNAEKYINFSVLIKKELDNGKTITSKLKFIDSFRFISSKLSSLVDNLLEGFHNKKSKECGLYRDYIGVKDEKLRFISVLILEKVQKIF